MQAGLSRATWMAVAFFVIPLATAWAEPPAGAPTAPAGWKAGLAKANITPERPMWLAGYGGRDRPAEGKLHDIWIKVLALEDGSGHRAVLLTSDLCGMPKWLYDRICEKFEKSHGLTRAQIRICNSHNHCAPAVRGDLEDYYPLDDVQRKLVYDYSNRLEQQMTEAITAALADMQPAVLSAGEGICTFAVNRRNNKEAEIPALLARGETPRGPVDHSVPVLAVKKLDGSLRAVVFGYACHATTLSFYQWCGDYAGFAQIALEKQHPGAMALFVAGCGGDQNPLPRRTVELCEKYGNQLADGTNGVLAKPMRPIEPRLRTAFEFVPLAFEKNPTREELEAYLNSPIPIRARWARRLLNQLDAGQTFAKSYPYAVQAWRLGDQLWVSLGGEALVGYSLRFKAEYGERTWVTSYTADLTAYIPTRTNWLERGYEVDYLHEYMLPADRWAGDVEERIAGGIDRLVKAVSAEADKDADAKPDGAAKTAPGLPSLAIAPTINVPRYAEHQELTYYLADGKKIPIRNEADWKIRWRHIVGNMSRVMGNLPAELKRPPLEVQQVDETRVGDVLRRKVTFLSDTGDRIAAWLFLPDGAGSKPAVLCLHQTTNIGKDEPAGLGGNPNMHYAVELAKRGYVTIAHDYPSLGEHPWDFFNSERPRGPHPLLLPPGTPRGHHWPSGSLKAVWDNLRAVDLLESLPEVDAERIGVIGHSLGGHNAMFTAVFDSRLKVIVSSCGFTRFHRDDLPSWTGPRYMPRISTQFANDPDRVPFDFPEIIACFAPRPFLAVAPLHDDDFDVRGVRESLVSARTVYELFNAADRLEAIYPDSPHDFPGEAREKAYAFLDRYLKDGKAKPE